MNQEIDRLSVEDLLKVGEIILQEGYLHEGQEIRFCSLRIADEGDPNVSTRVSERQRHFVVSEICDGVTQAAKEALMLNLSLRDRYTFITDQKWREYTLTPRGINQPG